MDGINHFYAATQPPQRHCLSRQCQRKTPLICSVCLPFICIFWLARPIDLAQSVYRRPHYSPVSISTPCTAPGQSSSNLRVGLKMPGPNGPANLATSPIPTEIYRSRLWGQCRAGRWFVRGRLLKLLGQKNRGASTPPQCLHVVAVVVA